MRPFFSLVPVFLGVFVLGCGPTFSDGDEGDPCESNGDCKNGCCFEGSQSNWCSFNGTQCMSGDGGSSGGGSGGGSYWVRSDGVHHTHLAISGSTARTCMSGTETVGTFNASEPSMTFVVGGDRQKYPLRFEGDRLWVGVPEQ